jgi:hypothetical protein
MAEEASKGDHLEMMIPCKTFPKVELFNFKASALCDLAIQVKKRQTRKPTPPPYINND